MIFGKSKCAFLAIDKFKFVESHEAIAKKGITINDYGKLSSKERYPINILVSMRILDMWSYLLK